MEISVSTKERTQEDVEALAGIAIQKLEQATRVTKEIFLKIKATHEEIWNNHLHEAVETERLCQQIASMSSIPVSRLTRELTSEDRIRWISEIHAQHEILSERFTCQPPPDSKSTQGLMTSSPRVQAEYLEDFINKIDRAIAIGERALERLEHEKNESASQLLISRDRLKNQIKKLEQAEKKARFFKALSMVSWFFSTFFGATVVANCTCFILDNFQNRAFPRERFLNIFLKNLSLSAKAAAIPVIIVTIGYLFLENPSLQRRIVDVFRHTFEKLVTQRSIEESETQQREIKPPDEGVNGDPPPEDRSGHCQNNTSKLLFGSVAVLAMALVRKSA